MTVAISDPTQFYILVWSYQLTSYPSVIAITFNRIFVLSSNFFFGWLPVRVWALTPALLGLFVVFYSTFGTNIRVPQIVQLLLLSTVLPTQNLLTFWGRNYFFLILAHPVYKM